MASSSYSSSLAIANFLLFRLFRVIANTILIVAGFKQQKMKRAQAELLLRSLRQLTHEKVEKWENQKKWRQIYKQIKNQIISFNKKYGKIKNACADINQNACQINQKNINYTKENLNSLKTQIRLFNKKYGKIKNTCADINQNACQINQKNINYTKENLNSLKIQIIKYQHYKL
ncbi:MAG: hypothetical protein LBT96_05355 [Campylobacteraceae bacterium]|nr:hypothetical protein [Campylobacteraceae bacterium]